MSTNDDFEETIHPTSSPQDEARLEMELLLVRKMRQAFTSSLQMLEAARDDLIGMGLRMERLQQASALCRTALLSREPSHSTKRRSQEFVGK